MYRSVFLSDVHLGNRGCQAERLGRFLAGIRTGHLCLVGDIIDFESMDQRPYWHESHTRVLKAVLGAARRGTRVSFVPGNHDHRLRAWAGRTVGNVRIERCLIHTAADGRRYAVFHGDEFDGMLRGGSLLAAVGAATYRSAIRLNAWLDEHRRRRGESYLPVATMLKNRLGSARRYMDRFREVVVETGRGLGVDGVICGHIHRPEVACMDGHWYLNTGDWVESCTAIAEHPDGTMELLRVAHALQGATLPDLRKWVVPA